MDGFKSAGDGGELAESLGGVVEVDVEFVGECEGGEGVEGVVATEHGELDVDGLAVD